MLNSFIINDLTRMLARLSKPFGGGSSPPGRAKKRIHIKGLMLFFYICILRLQKGCKKVAKPRPKKGPLIKAAQGKSLLLCHEFC